MTPDGKFTDEELDEMDDEGGTLAYPRENGVKLRTTREERAAFPFCSIPRCSHKHSVESRLAADIETLLAENTRLRALLVAEKRAHANDHDFFIGGRDVGETSAHLRAEADALEKELTP